MKSEPTPVIIDLPPLNGKTAAAILDILYALTTVMESHYYAQIKRHRDKLFSDQTHPLKIRAQQLNLGDELF